MHSNALYAEPFSSRQVASVRVTILIAISFIVFLPIPALSEAAEELTVQTIVDRSLVNPGQQVKLRIALHNRGKVDLSGFEIEILDAPGFEKIIRFDPNRTRGHSIPAGTTVIYRFDFKVGEQLGTTSFYAHVSWLTDGARNSQVLVSPPVTIKSKWSLELSLLEKLILPLTIAMSGWLVSIFLSRRAAQHETYKQQLTRVQEMARDHYMGIGSRARTLLADYQRCRVALAARSDSDWELNLQYQETSARCFASLLILLHQDSRFVRQEGGWILLDQHGENEIYEVWLLFRNTVVDVLGRPGLRRLLVELGEDLPHSAELLQRFEDNPVDQFGHLPQGGPIGDWHSAKHHLEDWLTSASDSISLEALICLLRCFVSLLEVELNRIYASLYGGANSFPRKDLEFQLLELELHCVELRTYAIKMTASLAASKEAVTTSFPSLHAIAVQFQERHRQLQVYRRLNKPGTMLWRWIRNIKGEPQELRLALEEAKKTLKTALERSQS